jgi:tetratricopeptide (TPR) repeat protein
MNLSGPSPFRLLVCLGIAGILQPFRLAAQSPAAQPPAVRLQSGKSGVASLYLEGHTLMTEGEKLRERGEFAAAYYKMRDARDLFNAVYATDPSWNTEVVEMRRRKILEEMEKVRQLEIQRRAGGGAPSPAGLIGSVRTPDIPFTQPNPPEDDNAVPRPGQVVMEERMKALGQHIQKQEKRIEEILKSLGAKEEELRSTRAELLDSRTSEKQLRERLVEARDRVATADAAEKRRQKELITRTDQLQTALKEATDKLAAANQRTEEMAAELTKAYAEIKTITEERDTLRRERDQVTALLAGEDGGKAPGKLRILEENQRLKRELATAQGRMAELTGAQQKDQQEIASLREQLKSVQDSVLGIQQENEEYRQQIASLTMRLEATSKRLADSGAAGTLPEQDAIAENQVLREIILQQLKQQARRERARQNLMDELNRDGVFAQLKEMGAESDKMLRAVNEMAAPVTLSKEQRDVLTSTQVSKLMTSADGRELFMVDDSAAPSQPLAIEAPEPNGAKDRAGLSPELKTHAITAEEYFRTGAFEDAENSFRRILTVEPQNVYALCNLGVTQLKLGKLEEASETLRKAQAYDFDTDFSHYLLGVSYLRQGKLDEAAGEIETGLKINPNQSAAWHTLGLILVKQGNRPTARAHFEKAVAVDPDCADAHFNLAVIFATSDPPDLETARRHYREAVRAGAVRDSALDKLLGV